MKTIIQFLETSPDELENRIFNRVKAKEFQPKTPTEFLTRNETRDMLKVDLSTIHNWTKRGKLKAYGIGNRVYYRRDEVEASIKPLKP